MREGGLVGFGGGASEKNWLERGGQPKKNEGKGGGGLLFITNMLKQFQGNKKTSQQLLYFIRTVNIP